MNVSRVSPFRTDPERERALRQLKLALIALAATGKRRDFNFVRLAFEWFAELRSL